MEAIQNEEKIKDAEQQIQEDLKNELGYWIDRAGGNDPTAGEWEEISEAINNYTDRLAHLKQQQNAIKDKQANEELIKEYRNEEYISEKQEEQADLIRKYGG